MDNENERESFIFYKSFYEALKEAEPKVQNELFIAICKKGLYNEDTELNGVSKMLYTLIKPQLEANTKRYNDGKKGGRPKKEKTTGYEKEKTTGYEKEKTTGYEKEKTTGYENKKPNNNVNVNENVNVNDNENNNDNVVGESCVDGLQDVIDFYQNNIGLITPYAVEVFTDYAKEMPCDVIVYAMKEAVEANARTIKYIKGTLNNWQKAGVKTLIQAEEESQKFKNNKQETKKEESEEEKIQRKIKALKEGLKNANK